MTLSPTARRVLGAIAWLLLLHILLAYGLPEWLFGVLLILLSVLYWRIGAANALMLSVTLLAITGVYALALRITGFEDRIYYRPDERYVQFDYANNHRKYKPGVDMTMTMPHGDLRAMVGKDISEPRPVRFQTDRDGFRNSRDYHGQGWLLVGDSFVTGHSNSQEDLLVSQLARDYGIDAYSLGNTGNLNDYAAYVRGFDRQYGNQARVALFLFEGNDFDEARERPQSTLALLGRRYYNLFSEYPVFRVTNSLLKRALRGETIRQGNSLDIVDIQGRPFAFLKRYQDVVRRPELTNVQEFEPRLAALRSRIAMIYFVPEKFRVYQPYVRPDEKLPHAQWNYLAGLCKKYDLRCTDLTPALVREAGARLKKNELLWWRDDTHWNRHGIAVAAKIVAADIKAAERAAK
jgi:hypothetical protein